jgi:hypothetical protein
MESRNTVKAVIFTLHKKTRRQRRQRGLIYEDLNKDKKPK